MKFYAYIPDKNGREPLGSSDKTMFELKTILGAKRRVTRVLGKNVKLFTYTLFYNEDTFKEIF